LFLGNFIDNLKGYVSLNKYIPLFIVLVLAQTITMSLSQYLLSKFGANIFRAVQENLYKKLLLSKLNVISTQSPSKWASHLTTDILSIRSMLSDQIPEVIIATIKLMLITVLILLMDSYIIIPILIFAILMISIISRIGNKLDGFAEHGQSLIAELNNLIADTILNIKTIKSSNLETTFLNKNKIKLNSVFRNHIQAAKTLAIGGPIINSLLFLLIIIIISIGGLQISANFISIGKFVTISVLILDAVPDLMTVLSSFSDFQEAHGQLRFVLNFINKNNDLELLPTNYQKIKPIKKLIFNNVSCAISGKQLFNPISFSASVGDIVLLKGNSGIGKTHLFDSIVRLNDAMIGNIYINDKSIQSMSTDLVRNYFAYSTSEDDLISGTIQDNILANSNLIKQLLLDSTDDFLNNLKNNIHKPVINSGKNYSTGQIKKIKNISVLLKKSPIILLDEPTSGLDFKSKKEFYKLLEKVKNKIIILISHEYEDEKIASKIINIS
jgi:ATP-binding cassette subfamily B protein